jgi:hypothetical protein
MKPIVLLLPLKPLGQVLGINLIHIEVVPARCSYSIRMKLVGALWSCGEVAWPKLSVGLPAKAAKARRTAMIGTDSLEGLQ